MAQLSVTGNAVNSTPPPVRLTLPERPMLAPFVQLMGELEGTGFRDRQWLIQRNRRFLQVTELLYRIAEHADGRRTLPEIATAVSVAMDRLVSSDQVAQVIGRVLIPRGLIIPPAGYRVAQTPDRVRSPLAVNMRLRMLGPEIVDPISRVLQVFFWPPVLIPVLVTIAVVHGWLYFSHGFGDSLRAVLFTPGALFILIGMLLVSGVFHELGHAAALRFSGGRIRGMGIGLYIVYPVLYTDVTDCYRLGRWARVRIDLGGFYFHLIFGLGMVALSVVTGQEFLLLGIPLIDVAIVRQSLPFVRFDGYWAIADLTGIPDFFALIGPFVRRLLPGRAGVPGPVPQLKPWVKAFFTGYVIVTVPLLVLLYILMIRGLPSLIATTDDALRFQMNVLSNAWGRGDAVGTAAAFTQLLFLGLPVLGIGYVLYSTVRRLILLLAKWSKPSPARRAIAALVSAGGVSLLALAWAPQVQPLLRSEPAGVQHFAVTDRSHVNGSVTYPEDPPVGGPHAPIWLNCGFYTSPVLPEYAVHSLEHGAVWITYRPDLPAAQVASLRQLARGHPYVIVSPYSGLSAPVVASAWGSQLALDSVDDARLMQFVRAFERGSQTPEPTAPCSGGVGQPEIH
jgi:putative peptide zinc metalloprotease protein